MSVIPFTVFLSLLLAGTFVVLFLRDQRRRHLTSPERDSLLPLADEIPQAAPHAHDQDHDHDDDHDHDHHPHEKGHACGCRTGLRPPCTGCLRQRTDSPAPGLPSTRS